MPGYSVDLPVQPSQGIFVLSTQPGTWSPSGTPYANPQQVYLRTGWNLVAAPFPSQGIGAATISLVSALVLRTTPD